MSMHISVVSIEGDHLHEVADVLRDCQYVIEDSFIVQTEEEVSRELDWRPDRHHVAKVAYRADGWTHIVDPELVLMSNDVWLEYSRKWNNRVVAWICEGASGSYGLTVFNVGLRSRLVVSVAGELVQDDGAPLPEEAHVDWAEASENEVLEIVQRFGADNDHLSDREYLVFRLDESEM